MFKDDRMISVLSAIVLMVAIGTVVQRADFLQGVVGSAPEIVLNTDDVQAYPNRLVRVDVFDNDEGLSDVQRSELTIVNEPDCGRVFRQGQVLQYLPEAGCSGTQIVRYGIRGESGTVGELRAHIVGPETTTVAASTGGENAVNEAPQKPNSTPSDASPSSVETVGDEAATDIAAAGEPGPESSEDPSDRSATTTVVGTLIQGTATPARAHTGQATGQTEKPRPETTASVAASQTEPKAGDGSNGAIAASDQELSDYVLMSAEPVLAPGGGVGARSSTAEPPQTDETRDEGTQLALAPVEDVSSEPLVQTSVPLLGDASTDTRSTRESSDRSTQVLAATGLAGAPDWSGPSQRDQSDTDIMVAIVERREPGTTPPAPPRVLGTKDIALPGTPASALPTVEVSTERYATLSPARETVLPSTDNGFDEALSVTPVDPNQLPLDPNPVDSSDLPPLKPSRVPDSGSTDPIQQAAIEPTRNPASRSDAPRTPQAPSSDRVASLPRHDAPCVIPPAMTIDVRRAARSIVTVNAPCHSNTVAQLEYSGLRLALPLNGEGKGDLTVLGFEPNAPALLSFDNGETIDFDLPFKGVERVSRVALVWEMPVSLELNAVEFGSALLSNDHVRPDNPRSFQDVRRRGGGFLHSYRSYVGIGQNAQVYSFWHRRGGRHGVVKLMIDYASRSRDLLDGTCGDGKYAAPNFLIIRSEAGRLERPIIRKLAPLDCSRVTQEVGDKRLISGAVSDLLVVER
ncbi:MAG: hypothetical protein AAGD13_04955 [Pseudomonadota bacterium]